MSAPSKTEGTSGIAGRIAREARATVSRVSIPELSLLRNMRGDLARGGLPPLSKRGPEDHVRLAVYRTLLELLRLIDEYRRRVENGERCLLVEREQRPERGRLVLEFAIVEEPSEPERVQQDGCTGRKDR